jgi:sirohydrochlorin cobaltochelatase
VTGVATRAVILFAHGSRDPLWSRPIEDIAERMRALDAKVQVCCAYLELTAPDLGTAVATMAARGVQQVSVVPMFLGVGRHARQDLPDLVCALQRRHPQLGIALQPALGEQPAVVDLVARIALTGIAEPLDGHNAPRHNETDH